MTSVNPIPDNYPLLSPYLSIRGAAPAIAYYAKYLGAEVRGVIEGPNHTVAHSELVFGTTVLMIADEGPANPSPRTIGGSPVTLNLYVDDVDAVYAALTADSSVGLNPPTTQFYGDRTAKIEDPFGHLWHLMTHVEDISAEEFARRAAELK